VNLTYDGIRSRDLTHGTAALRFARPLVAVRDQTEVGFFDRSQ
jgi:hypothetical protein